MGNLRRNDKSTVDQDQVLELVQIKVELDVLSVGNMTTLWKIVQICHRQKKSSDRTNVAIAWFRRAQDSIESSCSRHLQWFDYGSFKLMKGKNEATTFLP